ncbi:MAG: hypothetical protein DRP68_02860 [Candidatus Omnitrophota bacterium]|nr:MAG: hypothetical protein DRP68_02860 [Candidatus Omnitrophota bacterium]RKY45676.1 MAG: hypothetical protein DRP81_03140 [Candidatus Omnitrophota bacterium]HDN86261.1 hypothetical protein [Candidatus Omnitrophota bacterium]
MVQGSSTPERELLKLIEAERKGFSKRGEKKKRLRFSFLGALKGRWAFFKEAFSTNRKVVIREISLINRVLMGVVILLGFYVVVSNTFSFLSLPQKVERTLQIKPKSFKASSLREPSILKEASYYLDKVKKRNIFAMVVEKPKIKETEKKELLREVEEKTKNLKLVGIAWSDNPDAMIEDTKVKKTYFVKQGDIINGVRIERIFRDKVVLTYKGEKIELK